MTLTSILNQGVLTISSRNPGQKGRPCHPELESTVRYLGIEVDDALEIAEQTEV